MNPAAYLKITPQQIESGGLNFEDALILISSALLQLMRANLAQNPTSPELRQAVYDSVNQACANVLDKFDPQSNPNPTFNPEEEIAHENEAIRAALESLRLSNPKLYRRKQKEYQNLLSNQRAKVIEADFRRIRKN